MEIVEKIVKYKISDLVLSEYNPRQLTKDQHKSLTDSIKRFGLVDPIIINKHKDRMNIVIGGHMRLRICKELKIKVIPCVELKLTLAKEKELNIRLNKNVGEWDWDLLANFNTDDLFEWGFSEKDLIGFDDEPQGGNIEDDEIPEVKKAVCKTGDLWQLGEHRLLCGDATKKEDFEVLMGGVTANLCFTSPPYNMDGGRYKNYDDNLKSQEFIDFNLNVIKTLRQFLSGFLFWNMSYNKNSRWEWIEIFYRITKETGLKFLEKIVWDKGHGMPITSKKQLTRQYEDIFFAGTETEIENDLTEAYLGTTKKEYSFNKKTQKGITNYWRITTNNSQIEDNTACYPVALPVKGILLMTIFNNIVLDPFCGSGSTLIACEKTNRKCYGMEIDPHYCDVIIKRWEEFTGNKAKLLKKQKDR